LHRKGKDYDGHRSEELLTAFDADQFVKINCLSHNNGIGHQLREYEADEEYDDCQKDVGENL